MLKVQYNPKPLSIYEVKGGPNHRFPEATIFMFTDYPLFRILTVDDDVMTWKCFSVH